MKMQVTAEIKDISAKGTDSLVWRNTENDENNVTKIQTTIINSNFSGERD